MDTWPYQPPYIPEGESIAIAANSSTTHEPLIFFLPAGVSRRKFMHSHPNGAHTVTGVIITLPFARESSPELQWLARSECVRVESGRHESLAVHLDGGITGNSLHLDTPTPLDLNW